MRKLLNYLFGEDIVNEQDDREIKEALIGVLMGWTALILGLGAIYIFG